MIQRLLLPGLVVMALMIGGGYATGRELVEFFVTTGPATAIAGVVVASTTLSAGAMVGFELARRHATYDYMSFTRTLLGRGWVIFEFGYLAFLLLALSVMSAAAVALLDEMFGLPAPLAASAFIGGIAGLVFFGSQWVERVIGAWSILFLAAYGTMLALVLMRFEPQLQQSLAASTLNPKAALLAGVSFMSYNVIMLPAAIFVARHFDSRRQALIAGALSGALLLIPGLGLLFALCAFYPQVLTQEIPVSFILEQLDSPALTFTVRLVILGALIKSGTGMLHGLNERIARTLAESNRPLPRWGRPAIALTAMFIAIYVASSIGIIDLVKHGYRFSGVLFLACFLLPLLTRGTWMIRATR